VLELGAGVYQEGLAARASPRARDSAAKGKSSPH
jgi:hypothetical protein